MPKRTTVHVVPSTIMVAAVNGAASGADIAGILIVQGALSVKR